MPHGAENLGELFLNSVKQFNQKTAYIEFDCLTLTWRHWRWHEIHQRVLSCQAWLKTYDLKHGERVGIMAPNGIDWVIFDMAATGLGLVTVPFHLQESPETLAHVLHTTQPRIMLFGNIVQWQATQKALKTLGENHLLHCVCSNLAEAMEGLDEFETCLNKQEPLAQYSNDGVQSSALATIVFTSGTTGLPKGVQLTHGNLISNVVASIKAVNITQDDVFLSFLPLSHTFERTVGYYAPMMFGSTVAYNRSIPKLLEDLKAIRPTILVSVPRIYERIHIKIKEKVAPKVIQKALLDMTVSIGWEYFLYQQKSNRWHLSFLLLPLLHSLVASKILLRFGGRLRLTISGGAPLVFEVSRFFLGLGLPILQGYGMTETSPVVAVNRLDDNVPESAGVVLEGVETKLGEHNELMIRGGSVMPGYWKNPEATQKALSADGWLHSGDIARIEGKRIFITGRIKEIIVLASGEKFPPAESEEAILSSPLFDQVMVYGDQKPFACAIVVVNQKEWSKQAKTQADAQDLNSEAAMHLAIQDIKKRSRHIQSYAQIRGVVLSSEPWTAENELLSVTLKVKRNKVGQHFHDAIEEVYKKRRRL